jgi:acyl-CoA reductase-like NAD-dependent aldehyde dehydrogenase
MGLVTSELRGEEAILKEIVRSVTALRDTLREQHIRLTVLVLPLMAQPELWSSGEQERRRQILKALHDLRIDHVDLLPSLIDAIQRHIPIQESPGDIWHPSIELSAMFAQYIRNHGMLEQPTTSDGSP